LILKLLAYLALYSAVAIMLSVYPPDVLSIAAVAIGAAVTYAAARSGGRFERRVTSVYGSLAWSSCILLVFFVTVFTIRSGLDVAPYLLYVLYVLLGVSLAAVVGAKDYRAVLQSVSLRYAALGALLGIVVAWAAYAVPISVAPVVGVSTPALDVVSTVFVLMLYLVAIPEEFMGRVFAFHVGAATVDLASASVAAAVLGYALHAITRYPAFGVLALVTVVWSLVTAFYAYTRSLVGAVLFHAVYNTVVTLMFSYGVLPVFIPSLVVAVALAVYIARGG
jgi:hypothetical protein